MSKQCSSFSSVVPEKVDQCSLEPKSAQPAGSQKTLGPTVSDLGDKNTQKKYSGDFSVNNGASTSLPEDPNPTPKYIEDNSRMMPSKSWTNIDSSGLRNIIPAAEGPITCIQIILLVGTIGFMAGATFVCFSGTFEVSYHFYSKLMGAESLFLIVFGAGSVSAIALHVCNFYRCNLRVKAISGFVVLYMLMLGCAFNAKKYPSAPGLVLITQCPIVLGLLRYHSAAHLQISSQSFFSAAAMCYFFMGAMALVAWAFWVFSEDMKWGDATKEKMRVHMKDAGIFERYDLNDWNDCVKERDLKNGDKQVLSYCARIELTGFLIYAAPLIEFCVHSALGLFCVMRLRILEQGATLPERTLRLILFFLLVMVCAFWGACSTAGASMELSRAMFGCLGLAFVSFAVWLAFVLDLEDVMSKARDAPILKIFGSAVRSDVFGGLIFCFGEVVLVMFFMLEIFTRQVERLRCIPGKSNLLTERGLAVADVIRSRHWAACLEMAFNWCIFYLVLFLCSRFTPVFLAWLGGELEEMEFTNVCCIFYCVGLVMFLLPPVPGVPVYIAAGTIIVARAKKEPWLDFYSGCAFASILGLILKLNAVAMQQKLIGEAFGRSLYIQQLVGVHKTSIRAIENILLRPGLSMEKVAILCGGPDWPTSVLTGILRQSLPQMLLGTLPCFFLIIPCVLGGSSLNEDGLRNLSPMLIMMVGATQGGVFLAALLYIAKEMERSHTELSKPLQKHEKLLVKSLEVAKQSECYKRSTAWSNLGCFKKILLLVSVSLEVVTCWACFFFGGICFRKFSMGSDIAASESEGGLDRNVWNMVKGPGWLVFLSIFTGLVLFILYKCLAGRGTPKCGDGSPKCENGMVPT
jgi:hypothetical protein